MGATQSPIPCPTEGCLVTSCVLLYRHFSKTYCRKVVPPPLTMVQLQRSVEAWWAGGDATRRYQYVPLTQIADHLAHAVVAAEDARFFTHGGIDWQELAQARGRAQQHPR